MLDMEKSYQMAEEIQKGDDTRIANGKKLADACAKGKDFANNNPNNPHIIRQSHCNLITGSVCYVPAFSDIILY